MPLPSNALTRRFSRVLYQNDGILLVPTLLLLLFPSPWMAWGFIGALTIYAARWIAFGSPIPATPAIVPLVILLAMTGVGWWVSPTRDQGAVVVGQVVAGVTLFFVLTDQAQGASGLRRGAGLLVILGILLALAAPFTAEWTPDKVFGLPAFYDSLWPRLPKLTNANILAGALAPVVPVALGLVAGRTRRWQALGAIALAPLVLVLILLQSRGALFAVAVGVGVWATLYHRWLLPLIPIGLLIALVLNNNLGGPPPGQFLYGKIGTATGGTLVERQDMWGQGLMLVRQYPILGIGLGAYSFVAPFAPPYSAMQPGPVETHVHNMFLQIALDTGILGLAAFAALLALAFRAAWRAYATGIERPLAIGVLSAFVVVIVHGMGDTIMWGSKSSIVLWILLALAFGLEGIRSESRSKAAPSVEVPMSAGSGATDRTGLRAVGQ